MNRHRRTPPNQQIGPRRVAYCGTALIVATPFILASLVATLGPVPVAWIAFFLTCFGAVGHVTAYRLLLPAAKNQPAPPEQQTWPDVTLVIAAHNEDAVLQKKLENALGSVYPGLLDIVVASDGSEDRTDEIALSYQSRGVRLFRNTPRTGKAGMLRRVTATLDHEIVVFSDANAYYEPDAIRYLVAAMSDPSVGATTGNVRLLEVGDREQEVHATALEQQTLQLESASGSCVGVDGAMVAVRRELVPAYPDGLILDDLALAIEVANTGATVKFAPEATGWEYNHPSLVQEYSRRRRMFAGVVQLYRMRMGIPTSESGIVARFLGHKVWRWASPLYLVALLVELLLLIGTLPAILSAGGGVAALWTMQAVRHGPKAAAHSIASLTVIYAGAIHGLLLGVLNRQSGAWNRTARVEEDA